MIEVLTSHFVWDRKAVKTNDIIIYNNNNDNNNNKVIVIININII